MSGGVFAERGVRVFNLVAPLFKGWLRAMKGEECTRDETLERLTRHLPVSDLRTYAP